MLRPALLLPPKRLSTPRCGLRDLSRRLGPATRRSDAYRGGTFTRWFGVACSTHHVICISYMFRPRTPPALVLRRRHARGRGSGAKTRDRLVRAAAMEFNQVGYHGTNSNRLARSAGFAPAVFYQHFRDKRALFLAAYEAWVSAEWSALEVHAGRAADARSLARAIVAEVLAQHRRWRVTRHRR